MSHYVYVVWTVNHQMFVRFHVSCAMKTMRLFVGVKQKKKIEKKVVDKHKEIEFAVRQSPGE